MCGVVIYVWGVVIHRETLSSVCGMWSSVGGSFLSVGQAWSSVDGESLSVGMGLLSSVFCCHSWVGRGGHHVPCMAVGHQHGMLGMLCQRFGGGAVWLVPPLLPFFVAIVTVVVVVVVVVL